MSNETAGFTFVTPPRLVVGRGAATDDRLVNEAKRLGTRPLIVTGHSLRRSGALDTLVTNLRNAGLSPAVHEGVPPEPDIEALTAAMEAVDAAKADLVIAVGGGSPLDIGKAAAALSGTGHSPRDYFTGKAKVPEAVSRPIIAVPTTAGTGSEATWVSVLVDRETGDPYPRKASIRGGSMMPAVALLDAELTVTCPPSVTAASGMDAFVQALESFTSVGANPLTDALSRDALARIGRSLETAFREPENRPAREGMLLGSYMAGAALNTSRLGLVHGLAHPVGAITGAAHGSVCGLLMPPVARFNRDAAHDRYEDAAFSLGLRSAEALIDRIEDLLVRLAIPRRLSEIGVRPEHLDYIATESMKSGSTKANPRPVGVEDARAVLESCL
ncbi:MAG: iron-containing alcohol dehydrogenase [Capsulimonadales bacterium]|nr:iron-containing alcohol dehydrogenase [Capsulimonadales bacterium]